jgi:hypothetical protein
VVGARFKGEDTCHGVVVASSSELEKSIFLYDFSRIGSGLKRDLMTVDTTNY